MASARAPKQVAGLVGRRARAGPTGGPGGGATRRPQAQLLLPAGAGGPAFLAFPNHFVIRTYNNSLAYALSVGLLADRIGGARPAGDRLAARDCRCRWPTAWPPRPRWPSWATTPAPPDGLIGLGTRQALRAWQKDHAACPPTATFRRTCAGLLVARGRGQLAAAPPRRGHPELSINAEAAAARAPGSSRLCSRSSASSCCSRMVFGSFIISGGNMAVVLEALPHEMMCIGGAGVGGLPDLQLDDHDQGHRRRLRQGVRAARSGRPRTISDLLSAALPADQDDEVQGRHRAGEPHREARPRAPSSRAIPSS